MIDLIVYSPQPQIIAYDRLAAALTREGWQTAVTPSYVWVGGAREARDVIDGALYGWLGEHAEAARIRDLVARRPLDVPGARHNAIDELGRIADLAVCWTRGIAFAFESGELDDHAELSPLQRERLAHTRTQYVIQVPVRASELSRRLHEATWLALAAVSEGVRLEPSGGVWYP